MCAFLDKLGELRSLQPLAASMCRKMNDLYDLDSSQNFEVSTWPPAPLWACPWLSAHRQHNGARWEWPRLCMHTASEKQLSAV